MYSKSLIFFHRVYHENIFENNLVSSLFYHSLVSQQIRNIYAKVGSNQKVTNRYLVVKKKTLQHNLQDIFTIFLF